METGLTPPAADAPPAPRSPADREEVLRFTEAIRTGTVPDLLKPFALDRPSLGQAATADEPPPATDRPVAPARS